jgi:hypothetical protein
MQPLSQLAFWSIAVLASSPGASQDKPVQVIGWVADDRRKPVAGVEVIINRREVRTTTDAAGLFTITIGKADSTIAFRKIGYRPALLSIRPLPPAGDTIEVAMTPSPVQLPELIATAPAAKPLRYAGTAKYDEVFLRKKLGLGSFLMREDLERKFVMSTPELLQGLPGVRVLVGAPGARGQNDVRVVRCPEPRGIGVFIDGTRLIPKADDEAPIIDMLSRVNPAEIEMIEVYRGPGEIPGVYHWDGCAVIAIWTKWNK